MKPTLQNLLGLLQALYQLEWAAHWQSMGDTAYQDHLLLNKLYDTVAGEVDACAEKLVGLAQSGIPVGPLHVITEVVPYWLQKWCWVPNPPNSTVPHETQSPVSLQTVLLAEKDLQTFIQQVYGQFKQSNTMTLGLDDFLMSMANTHETHLYLLQQRVGVAPSASRVATAWRENPAGPSNPDTVFFDSPRAREVREFAQSKAVSNMGDVAKKSVQDSGNTSITVRQEAAKVNKSPPTPVEITDETPGADEFSTLSRYVVFTEQPTDKGVPQSFDDIDKHPMRLASLESLWFKGTP